VVAYHGPKQRDKALDAAIVAAATKSDAPARITALALLGYLVHRQAVPDKLLAAGLSSDDKRARSTAVEALKAHASQSAIARLVQRLGDENPRIRALAAEALGAMNTPEVRTWTVAAALVRALDLPGEDARKRITRALSTLTGNEILYDPDAPEARRNQTLQAWRDWLKARRR
jgi:HEAT repeat protein